MPLLEGDADAYMKTALRASGYVPAEVTGPCQAYSVKMCCFTDPGSHSVGGLTPGQGTLTSSRSTITARPRLVDYSYTIVIAYAS
jgi:hypothetical protein